MKTFYNKTLKNKKLFTLIILMCLASCARPDAGFAPSAVLDASEVSSTERVIFGNYEIQGTTEELVDKKVSGSVTIEGVFHE
jgi:hypothetical protein